MKLKVSLHGKGMSISDFARMLCDLIKGQVFKSEPDETDAAARYEE